MDKGIILAIACLVGAVAIWVVALFSFVSRAPHTASGESQPSPAAHAAWRRVGVRHLRVWGLTLIPLGVVAIVFVARAPGIVAAIEGVIVFASFAWLVLAMREAATAATSTDPSDGADPPAAGPHR